MTPSKLCRRIPVQVQSTDPTMIDAVLQIHPETPCQSIRQCGARACQSIRRSLWPTRCSIVNASMVLSSSSTTPCLRTLLGLDAAFRASVSVPLVRDKLPTHLLASMCAGLPHSMTVKSLEIDLPETHAFWRSSDEDDDSWRSSYEDAYREPSDFDVMEWAWLGYALFHPDPSTSAWRELSIDVSRVSARTRFVYCDSWRSATTGLTSRVEAAHLSATTTTRFVRVQARWYVCLLQMTR